MIEQGGELSASARALLDAARDGLTPDAAAVRDRDAPREPQTLVALFARGLGIPEDEIAGLSARPAERA